MKTTRTTFFTRDKKFYKTFFRLMLVVALQNLVAYSVNMLDNIMLGSYSQNALSGAATVNQIFFIVNQLALSIGNALVAICSQYWGKQETGAIRKMTGVALALSVLIGAIVVTACTCIPEQLLRIFTTSPEIIAEGKAYLGLLKWTFLLFMISNLLIAMLRSVETVKISFVISVVSLITNGCINYTLIFGHFGFPEMGIQGAAVGTLTARMLELLIIVVYIWKIDTKVRLFDINLFRTIFLPENRKIWGAFSSCVSDHVLRDDLGNLGTDADGDSGAFVCGCNCRKFCIQHIFPVSEGHCNRYIIGIGRCDRERYRRGRYRKGKIRWKDTFCDRCSDRYSTRFFVICTKRTTFVYV